MNPTQSPPRPHGLGRELLRPHLMGAPLDPSRNPRPRPRLMSDIRGPLKGVTRYARLMSHTRGPRLFWDALGRPRPHPRRPRGIVSPFGRGRRRSAGEIRPIEWGRESTTHDLRRAAIGFRFPTDGATPRQRKAFDRILTAHIREELIHRYDDRLPAEVFASAFGLSPRKTAYLAKAVRERPYSPEASLVLRVLHGMLTGEIAGVSGTRRMEGARFVFDIVDRFDLGDRDIRALLSVDGHGNAIGGDQYRRNCRLFDRLQSAFRLDYLRWRDE